MSTWEKVTVVQPQLGDSITEGTIVEWVAHVGEAVNEGDVVALIETDKVTIDIKADVSGVITQHFGQVEDNIEVGEKLYEVDTEGAEAAALVQSSNDDDRKPSDDTTTATSSSNETTSSSDTVRVPSIKFLNKNGWIRRRKGLDEESSSSDTNKVSSTTTKMSKNQTTTLDSTNIGPMYGRLPFSEREMDAIIVGGASEAPHSHSGYY